MAVQSGSRSGELVEMIKGNNASKDEATESIKGLVDRGENVVKSPPGPTIQDVVEAMRETFGELRSHVEAIQANHNALVQTTAMMAELLSLSAPNSELARSIMAKFQRNAG